MKANCISFKSFDEAQIDKVIFLEILIFSTLHLDWQSIDLILKDWARIKSDLHKKPPLCLLEEDETQQILWLGSMATRPHFSAISRGQCNQHKPQ